MKRADPKFPKRAMAEAEKIDADYKSQFGPAEDALQKAIDERDRKVELFWRKVFEAYAHILHARGDADWADIWNLATMYSIPGGGGSDPYRDPNPEEVELMRKNHRKITRIRARPVVISASLVADDDIPI